MDMALITGVPEWLLGGATPNSKPISPEHEMQRWMYTGLGPRLARIESAINADPDLFGAGADYAGFDTADVIRGDLTTEADIAIRKVQAGIWLADEARSRDSLGPLPDGAGQIVQITPVGGAPNANPSAGTGGQDA
jgi:phage portal protein BeeE